MTEQIKQFEAQPVEQYLSAMGLVKKLTANESQQFAAICQAYELNPFKKEIYAIKYGDTFSIIVGYETYIKRAERSGKLAGWSVATSGKLADNSLKAIITIYRKDWQQPFIHEVYFQEYQQNTKIWKEKPITMIKKVAISQGFRMCFSDELGGMPYTAEEVQTEDIVFQEIETISKSDTEIEAAVSEIIKASTLEDVKSIWMKYKKLQKNIEFINAKNNKKDELDSSNEVAPSN